MLIAHPQGELPSKPCFADLVRYVYRMMYIFLYIQDCYEQLYKAGMKGYIRNAPRYYDYYHQKFWIVDNTTVHLSTGVCMCACVHIMCLYACVCICVHASIHMFVHACV